MADDDEAKARDNAKGLIKEALSELLDEREVKAREEKEKEEKEKPEPKRTEEKPSWMTSLLGF